MLTAESEASKANTSRPGRVEGKIAIVSGAGSGMGLTHVRALAKEGARVLGFDLVPGSGPGLVDEFGADKVRFTFGDVTSPTDWQRVVEECANAFGPVNILVNNAGVFRPNRVDSISESEYRSIIEVNQFGTYFGMNAVASSMRQAAGGSIVNIASTAGLVAFVDNFAYVASKFAVRGMTRAAALDLAADGIRVNCVCPSETDTPMVHQEGTPDGAVAAPEEALLGRWARPEEISAAVLFLASDESSYMTGSDLVVDGAYTAT